MSNDTSLTRRIAKIRARREVSDLFVWPRKSAFPRLVSTNELEQRKNDIFKCVHNKHYFVPCVSCKRTQSDADKQLRYYKERVAQVKSYLNIT